MVVSTAHQVCKGSPVANCATHVKANAALPHGGGTDRRLRKHDLVLVDVGATLHSYVSDVTRVRMDRIYACLLSNGECDLGRHLRWRKIGRAHV